MKINFINDYCMLNVTYFLLVGLNYCNTSQILLLIPAILLQKRYLAINILHVISIFKITFLKKYFFTIFSPIIVQKFFNHYNNYEFILFKISLHAVIMTIITMVTTEVITDNKSKTNK